MRSPNRGWSIADTVVVLCILAACAFLHPPVDAASSPVPAVCPDTSMSGKGPSTIYPCASKVATAKPANGALVARANDATGAKSYWSAWSGVPATAYVLTDQSTWVLKSVLTSPAPAPACVGTASVSWAAVTTATDNTALTAPVVYNVYRGSSAAALALYSSTANLAYQDVALCAGSYFYAVSAIASGVESAKSATVSKVIAAAAPAAPKAPAANIK